MTEQRTVYLVSRGKYSEYHIVGIYDSKALAERVRDLMGGDRDGDRAGVQEWTLNEPPASAYPPGLVRWSVSVYDDGRTTAQHIPADDSDQDDAPYRWGREWEVLVWAPDEATARKIGQDRIAQHRVEREGIV